MPLIQLVDNFKENPGLSSFYEKSGKIKKGIKSLLHKAINCIKKDEPEIMSISLMATAGLRKLVKKDREYILNEIGELIQSDSRFELMNCLTISGRYEGLYGWLAANYLDDKFSDNKKKSREGILELGGASCQIVFLSNRKTKNANIRRKIGKRNYKIFSKSFMFLGVKEMRKFSMESFCNSVNFDLPNNAMGTGDCDNCFSHIFSEFERLCDNLNCNVPYCIFEPNSIPSVKGSFYALSNFYYNINVLEIGNLIDVNILKTAVGKFCKTSYSDLNNVYKKADNRYLQDYCPNLSYIWLLLAKGFKLDSDNASITIAGKINNTTYNWTLGAIIDNELGYLPEKF